MQPPEKNRNLIFIISLFILSIVLRLGYLFFLRNNYFFYDNPSADVLYYQEWAHEIAMGNFLGDKAFFGLPLYPYFLGILERLTRGNLFLMRLFHLILGSINCVLIYVLAQKFFSEKVAKTAALLAACNFLLIYYDWLMMPVTLLIFLSLIIILAFFHSDQMAKKRDWFILGLMIGLTILGDGKFLIFFVLSVLYISFKLHKYYKNKTIKIILPLTLGMMIVLSLVTVRNKIVGGDWVFISAQSGLSFYVGNNSEANGIFENPDFIRPTHTGQDEDQKIIAEAIAKRSLTPGQVSQFWRQKAFTFIHNEPLSYLNLIKTKFLIFFTDTERAYDIDLILQKKWKNLLDFNPFFIICPLALLGLFFSWRYEKNTQFINLLLLSQLFLTLIFFLTNRHRTTILPFLLIYEAYFIWWFIERIRQRKIRHLVVTASMIGLFLFLFKPQTLASEDIQFTRHAKAGPAYERQKQYPRAREEYFQALALRPSDTNTLYNLANSYLLEENFTKAQTFYQKALDICPYNVDALYNLGYSYEKEGAAALALQTYKKVLEYQPDDLDTHFRIAGVYTQRGDCSKAKEHLSRIIEIQPRLKKKLSEMISQCENDL